MYRLLSDDFHIFDVTNEHGVFRNTSNLGVAVTEMRASSELTCSASTNAFQSIPETRDKVSVPNSPDSLLVFDEEISSTELDVVSEPHPITLL